VGETPWRFDSSHPHSGRAVSKGLPVTTADIPEGPAKPVGPRVARVLIALARIGRALEPGRRWLGTTRGKRIFNTSVALIALGISALAARHFASTGWPLEHVNPLLAAASGVLIVLSYPLKALGWRRVFRPSEAPSAMSLAAANGAASVTGAALPGRFDEVVRIAVIRRYPSCPACVSTVAFSLFVVGLLDAAAMTPIAASAAATTDGPAAVTAGLSVVAATGVGAALIVVLLPRVMASGRLIRFRVARWIHQRLIPQ
jgi:hypothetical protein